GPVDIGVESTVLDVCTDPPLILRPGGLSREDLESVLGPVEVDEGLSSGTPRSPGVKYRHYAPSCPALVVEGDPDARAAQLAELVRRYLTAGRIVGVIVTAETAGKLQQGSVNGEGILLLR